MDQAKPLLFSFDYPPLGGGISRLCHEIVKQSAIHENTHFTVVTNIKPRPWRELLALKDLLCHKKAPFYLCGVWYPEALIATLALKRPLVILAHGSELMPTRQKWRRKIWSAIQRIVLTRADLVIANSTYTKNLVLQTAPDANVIALPLAVNTDYFSPGDKLQARQNLNLADKFIVSSVARIHMYKGIDTVLQAIAKLPDKFKSEIIYAIAGSGPDKDKLQELSKKLNIENQIVWLGKISEENLLDLYRASDLFTLCTKEKIDSREVEGFGLVFLEAQACSTPVIGTRAGGIPDAVIENQGGWLINQDDSDDLASKLLHLVSNPERAKQQGQLGLKRIQESCTWKLYVKKLLLEIQKCH